MVDSPNQTVRAAFEVLGKKGIDLQWLRSYLETHKGMYFRRIEVDRECRKQQKRSAPKAVKDRLKALENAISEVREVGFEVAEREGNRTGNYFYPPRLPTSFREVTEALENKREILSVLLIQRPKGHQMNYMLNYSVYWVAEKIKERTKPKSYHWQEVADLISHYLQVEMDPKSARKAHGQFSSLRNNTEKFVSLTTAMCLDHNWTGEKTEKASGKAQVEGVEDLNAESLALRNAALRPEELIK